MENSANTSVSKEKSKKIYVSMTDKFMSGWGDAKNKKNKFIVICDDWKQAEAIERSAQKRSEMKYINICIKKPYYNSNSVLCSWRTFEELGDIWKQGYTK